MTAADEAEVEARFLARAARDRARIALLRETGGPAARATTLALAHGLRGAGGTFGFPALSEAAGLVEDLIEAGTGDARLAAAVDALLAALDGLPAG